MQYFLGFTTLQLCNKSPRVPVEYEHRARRFHRTDHLHVNVLRWCSTAGQSDSLFVPSVMKTRTPLTDDPAQEEDLLQRYQERVERLSQQNRVIEFCTDAGFLTTVDVGQYFMTKDTDELFQFAAPVTCREYILSHETTNHLIQKVGFEGTLKLDSCWKSQPASYKVNMEWKLELNL